MGVGVRKGRVGPRPWQSRAEVFVVKPSKREQTFRRSNPQLCTASHVYQECSVRGRAIGVGTAPALHPKEVSSSTVYKQKNQGGGKIF